MSVPTPQAVVFDLGKVLIDFDYGIAARRFSERGRLSPEEVRRLIDHSPLLFKLETGAIPCDRFFSEVCAMTGYNGTMEEFSAGFGDIFSPIDEMIGALASLRAGGVPAYVFSNTNDLAIRHIARSFPFYGTFSGYILSHEHGAMKPDARLYEVVERVSGLRGADLAYLDDREENIAAGAARGWRTIHHHSPEQSLAAMRRMGLPVPGLSRSDASGGR